MTLGWANPKAPQRLTQSNKSTNHLGRHHAHTPTDHTAHPGPRRLLQSAPALLSERTALAELVALPRQTEPYAGGR